MSKVCRVFVKISRSKHLQNMQLWKRTVLIWVTVLNVSTSIWLIRFGCCSDGETPASGPDGEGCDENKLCENGPFGCCPDERTWAQGPKKQGCFECPPEVCVHILTTFGPSLTQFSPIFIHFGLSSYRYGCVTLVNWQNLGVALTSLMQLQGPTLRDAQMMIHQDL